jgi:Rps23 Pro-64 3,4-dihydroxylase Tpa1-like proline 4-hydroxylase
MSSVRFRLNPALDPDKLAGAFRERGRLHIPDFLTVADAEQLLASLEESDAWTLVMNQGDKLLELDRRLQADISPQKQAQVDEAVYAAAQRGFQFRYENIRVPHSDAERAAEPSALNSFARFLSNEKTLSILRRITGAADISFADARATSYGPGHFLTTHDDDAPDQSRRVAYVFNLTKQWNVDWGGLLTFHDHGSMIAESFIPAFNALNLFTVPRTHCVGLVSPFAARRRYAVTGWLRGGPRP